MIIDESLKKSFKEHKFKIIFFFILSLLTFPLEVVVIPRILSKLVDKNIIKQNFASLLIIVFVTLLISAISTCGLNLLTIHFHPQIQSNIKKDLYETYIYKHETDFQEVNTTKEITRIFEISERFIQVLFTSFTIFIPLALTIIIICVYLSLINLKIGMIFIICIILILIVQFLFAKKGIYFGKQKKINHLNLSKKMNSSFDNLINIYLTNNIEKEKKDLLPYHNKVVNSQKTQYFYSIIGIFISTIILILTIIFIIYIANKQVKNKILSFKTFVSIIFLITFTLTIMINTLKNTPIFISNISNYLANITFLKELSITNNEKFIKNPVINGNIEFINVNFNYENNNVIKNFSEKILNKQKVAIFGKSGSGKSTLMKLLLKLHPINSGKILINGVDLKKIDHRFIRDNVIYINQRTSLFDGTVLENIMYGTNKSEKHILTVMKKYGFMENFSKLNKGVYNDVGVLGRNLSGGMQKIVINLRGLFKESKIYIFDEPLAGLDDKTQDKMINAIKGELKDKTIIIISHNPKIIKHVDKVIKFSN